MTNRYEVGDILQLTKVEGVITKSNLPPFFAGKYVKVIEVIIKEDEYTKTAERYIVKPLGDKELEKELLFSVYKDMDWTISKKVIKRFVEAECDNCKNGCHMMNDEPCNSCFDYDKFELLFTFD